MKTWIAVVVSVACTTAFAQAAKEMKPAPAPAAKAAPAAPAAAPAAPAMAMDMSKMGPWTRKPKNEGAVKKEITEFFKEEEELMKKGDMDAGFARIDFPVFMSTDDSMGKPESKMYSKEEYTAMMKPFYENMPKDMKTTHKPTITVLSDSMVNVVDDFAMSMGKQKMAGRSMSLLVKRDGKWMWKVMAEPGWGGMSAPGTGGSEPMKH